MTIEPVISTFLVKVASRCNLDCDYCYVFNHADQSWRSLPPLLSYQYRLKFAERLSEYIKYKNLTSCLIIFHGGEPLLIGSEKIVEMVELVRDMVSPSVKLDFSLQTNGVLLKRQDLQKFLEADVGVSLSIDGPKAANDLHRLTHKGKSSYEATLNAYTLLQEYPNIFTGVISVIDVRTPPEHLFEFFNELNPPSLDFLLPDANYLRPPPYRDRQSQIYQEWLIRAFDLWFDYYPNLKVRFFESLLAVILGGASGTDAFGFGDVTLLSIETDGSYHDLDVLKITQEGQSALHYHLDDHSIYEASLSAKVQEHRSLLSFDGLSDQCKVCAVVEVCGGGAVPHRYEVKNGFKNPSIYCKELFNLIIHAKNRLSESIDTLQTTSPLGTSSPEIEVDVVTYNESLFENREFDKVEDRWIAFAKDKFLLALQKTINAHPHLEEHVEIILSSSPSILAATAKYPAIQLWSDVIIKAGEGNALLDLDNHPLLPQPEYVTYIRQHLLKKPLEEFSIHEDDPWLRLPFGSKIIFEPQDFLGQAKPLTLEALDIIKQYNGSLITEMQRISPVIQFIQDPSAHPDKLVSFSDNVVPGALYISLRHSQGLACPFDIADSLIHEHRHQKLYLLEKVCPVVMSDYPYVSSPWREEPRPVSGLYHAVFVFFELTKYWQFLSQSPRYLMIRERAHKQTAINLEMLEEGIKTLESSPLTEQGRRLLSHIKNHLRE